MQRFIEEALQEAKKAYKKGEVPVGCVIFKGNEIVAKAHNLVETLRDPTAHAEILAIREATRKLKDKYLTDCEAVVTLEPCIMCSYAFVLARIRKIYFLALDEKHGGVMSLYNILDDPLLNHRVRWEYVPVEEASRLLSEFFKKLR
ncbi:nucleoside deaminase [Aquifex sp.]